MTAVLVPLDGSELAERALPYALELARATHGRLLLVRAVLANAYEGEGGAARRVPLYPRVQVELEAVAERLRAAGVDVQTHVAFGIAAADSILAAAAEHGADLVVMSTHGRGGLGRFLYGSVADEVLRRGDVPVLLVSAGCEGAWPSGATLRVLVPLDGSDLSQRALEPLADLARALPLELILARAVPMPAVPMAMFGDETNYTVALAPDPGAAAAAARAELEDEAARLAGRLDVADLRVEQGRPAATIAALAREEGAHLIAMSTHGRGGLSRLVMGSVATGTLQHATVPLLLVPAAVRDAGVHDRAASGASRAAAASAQDQAPPAAAATATPAGTTLVLSESELALVEYGLEMLQLGAERDELRAGAIRDLRRRLAGSSTGGEMAAVP
jgi:nucleotide-binding universal stress UspA family protein